MITVNEQASHRTARLHRNALCVAAFAATAALALTLVAASPAFATSQDGTSNTIQFSAASAVIDQAHHRVLVTAPGVAGLEPGRHFDSAKVVTPRYTILMHDVLVSSVAGTSTSLSLNFTQINVSY